MTTHLDTDTCTWVITGTHYCDVNGCSQPADIIADVCDYDRFCINHLTEAANVAAVYPVLKGWYRIRIVDSRYDALKLVLTVHPL